MVVDLRGRTQIQSGRTRWRRTGSTHQLLNVVAREDQLSQVRQRLFQILPDATGHTLNRI